MTTIDGPHVYQLDTCWAWRIDGQVHLPFCDEQSAWEDAIAYLEHEMSDVEIRRIQLGLPKIESES